METASDETVEREALAIIEAQIARWDRHMDASIFPPAERFSFSSEAMRRALNPTPAERFASGVFALLAQIADSARYFRDDDVSGWLIAIKPHLSSLVGWSAQSELGRAAGSRGYMRLHARWNEAWDRAQEPRRAADAAPPA